jgi:hypothetical protein
MVVMGVNEGDVRSVRRAMVLLIWARDYRERDLKRGAAHLWACYRDVSAIGVINDIHVAAAAAAAVAAAATAAAVLEAGDATSAVNACIDACRQATGTRWLDSSLVPGRPALPYLRVAAVAPPVLETNPGLFTHTAP